jgi:hypothetical protein
MRRHACRWAVVGVLATALGAPGAAAAQTPYYELGAVQCLNGGEMRVYPPPVMRPSDGSGPEAVAWSPKIVVSTGGDNVVDYNTSAPWYQASTTSIGYGFTPYGRGFYGPRGQLSFVPFSGISPGRYFVRHLLYWAGLGTFYVYGPGCDFLGPDGTLPLPAPPTVPPAPAPAPAAGPASSPSLFASAAPSSLSWWRLRRGYTLRVRSPGAGARVSARLSVGTRLLARRTRTARSATPVALTLRVSQRRLRRFVGARVRSATITLSVRSAAGQTSTTRHRVTLRRG